MILTLVNSPLAQLTNIFEDDERTANELWDAVDKLYRIYNAQPIFNLEQELENLQLDDKKARKGIW